MHVDLQQALLKERVLFIDKIDQITAWSTKRCLEICGLETKTFEGFHELQTAREFKETSVESELLINLHECIEAGKVVEFRLNLGATQLEIVKNERLVAEKPKEKALVRIQGVKDEWDATKLGKQVDGFFS